MQGARTFEVVRQELFDRRDARLKRFAEAQCHVAKSPRPRASPLRHLFLKHMRVFERVMDREAGVIGPADFAAGLRDNRSLADQAFIDLDVEDAALLRLAKLGERFAKDTTPVEFREFLLRCVPAVSKADLAQILEWAQPRIKELVHDGQLEREEAAAHRRLSAKGVTHMELLPRSRQRRTAIIPVASPATDEVAAGTNANSTTAGVRFEAAACDVGVATQSADPSQFTGGLRRLSFLLRARLRMRRGSFLVIGNHDLPNPTVGFQEE